MHDIPGSFPCTDNKPEHIDFKAQETCIHHWICDPPIDNTSLCICQKCFKEQRMKNRVYFPKERDGYVMMGGSVGGGSPLTGLDLITGVQAEY